MASKGGNDGGSSKDASKQGSEDRTLWRRVAAGVAPIDRNRRSDTEPADIRKTPTSDGAKGQAAPPPIPKPAAKAKPQPQTKKPSAKRSHADLLGGWEVHGAVLPGVHGRTASRLTRGQKEIDATLDLHGSRQHDAQRQLQQFIQTGVQSGHRCLLVITGKGRSRVTTDHDGRADVMAQAPGVIKRRLLDWRAMPGLAEHILAVKAAQPRHGGGGAFYVLLKRKR